MKKWQQIWSKNIAQRIDQLSTEEYKLPSIILMEHAGKAVAHSAQNLARNFYNESSSADNKPEFIILVGKGNNGGDGMVAARWLKVFGEKVRIITAFNPKQRQGLSSLTLGHIETCSQMEIALEEFSAEVLTQTLQNMGNQPIVVVDAIFGIGFRPPMPENELSCLRIIAAYKNKKTMAVDLPSGMECDSFSQNDVVPLSADITVTFGAAKPCHIGFPIAQYCGILEVIDIGFVSRAVAKALSESEKIIPATTPILSSHNESLLNDNRWKGLHSDAHKFDRGHVLVLGGSPGKWGAPVLAAMAALRSGAGWASVSLLGDDRDYFVPPSYPPEITFEKFFRNQKLLTDDLKEFVIARKVKSLVVGPGMMPGSLGAEDFAVLGELCLNHSIFVVIDAGALYHMLDAIKESQFDPRRCVITPHPGEWLNLSAVKPLQIPMNLKEVKKLSARLSPYGITAVFKNASPMIFDFMGSEMKLKICQGGTNSLAKAGTGDVLSGIIASHGAMGYEGGDAVARSYALLCQSAQSQSILLSAEGLLPRDLISGIVVK